ncbi:translation initiation factor eIF-2B subunit alpha [Folsomia candida]|uniref:translation initiation factor eIF-2B subunit alpha n=1 Tax=Folsomia candida TaxID=158441 RepID=UPI000B8F5A4D|nr:translation initiation factor eIF-2B subunit alpha [Folsomia candida]
MLAKDIEVKFNSFLGNKDHGGELVNPAIGAVSTLMSIIEGYSGTTINGLMEELREAVKIIEAKMLAGKSKLAVSSACAQFIRYTTLYLGTIESEDVSSVTKLMLQEGGKYLKRCESAINRISKLGVTFIFDGARVMVHSHSRVLLETLHSVPENIYFTIYLVSSEEEDNKGKMLHDRVNIEYVRISDAEVGTRMENVDLVFVGAEAVVKNGGIINKVGTLPMAICAREMKKPLYVFAESFKFSLVYPLNQNDIPNEYRVDQSNGIRVDYTPPKYLTLLITDRGILTPVAVCDELIEMYT